MTELATALDILAAQDVHALPAGLQLASLAELATVRNRLDAEIARRVRVAETTQAADHDGHTTMAPWLRGHVHWLGGGETEPENSGLLCERHHTQVHHGFRIERDPNTEILVRPRLRT